MKKITFLLAAILFAGLSMAQTLAEVVDLSKGIYADSKITWSAVNDNITIEQLQGSGPTAVNKQYISAPRAYKAHILKFTCKEGYTIAKVTINYTGKYLGSNFQVGNEVKGDTLVVNNTTLYTATLSTSTNGGTHEFVVTNPNGESTFAIQNNLANGEGNTQLRPTEIKIAFIKTATTTPTISCSNVNFGAVNIAKVNTKTIAVIGENLTENITATLADGTAFAVAGELTATGGELTITLTAKEAGEYTDVLTLKSGEKTKEVTVSAKACARVGEGTEEKPYTVADVLELALLDATKGWLEGYIVGSVTSNGVLSEASAYVNSNIALADATDESTSVIAVQLQAGEIRTALNVKDNPTMLGAKVAVYGSFESYCTIYGVKNTSDYKVISNTSTAVDNVTVNQNITKFFENGQLIIVKDGVKFNAQGQMVK